jgi:hypothetical protein
VLVNTTSFGAKSTEKLTVPDKAMEGAKMKHAKATKCARRANKLTIGRMVGA